jgi:fumarate reductase subunit D
VDGDALMRERRPSRLPTEVEPLAWLAFSGGGVAAALFAPVMLFLVGIAFPLGWISPPDHASLVDLLSNPLTRLVLLGVLGAALLHFAHRFRYTLEDGLQLSRFDAIITRASYGLAGLGTMAAAYVLLIAL